MPPTRQCTQQPRPQRPHTELTGGPADRARGLEGELAMKTRERGLGLPEEAVQAFRTRLRGQLISPGDPEYDAARRVHNGMIDRYPRLITRCRDVADVMAAIDFGRENGMTVAVRSGGHNAAGFGTVDDGLVIDLSPMKGIHVHP